MPSAQRPRSSFQIAAQPAITRRLFLATGSCAGFAALAHLNLRAQGSNPAPVTGTFSELRDGVATFSARGGTIGVLVRDDALVVVDSQFPDTAKQCLEGLRQRSGRKIDVLFNTHHHADHTGGNPILGEAAARIVAQQNVPTLQKAAAQEAQSPGDQVYAGTLFADEWKLSLGKENLVARHYGAGHTGGDSVVFFEHANVAHMGDLVFNRRHPFIDRQGGASVRNWIVVLEKVAAQHDTDTRYIFGHAGEGYPVVGQRADLLAMRDYLSALWTAAEAAVKKGTPRDQFVATQLPSAFAVYDPKTPPAKPNPRFGLPANLGTAYDEAAAAK
jgi:glyoxylase-like metal-dependent hydrolase (beta-lactamase superfamily II)